MRGYIERARGLITSKTAKDTYILFSGNVMSAFLGFVFVLFVARSLSIEQFGIFSAATNLVAILLSLLDVGISSGIVNFVSEKLSSEDKAAANQYIKAALVIRTTLAATLALLVAVLAGFVSSNFLATTDVAVAYWVAAVTFFMSFPVIFPFILQAKKRFISSVLVDNIFYFLRLIFAFIFIYFASLTVFSSLSTFIIAAFLTIIVGIYLVGTKFIRSKPTKDVYRNLLKYSGWLGVNRIISAISGKLDIQMLAALAGATATGLYSIPSRLASFIVVLTSSFSRVLATRLAGFGDKQKERLYIVKATLAILPIIAGILLWIAIAEPFIVILFGEKYLSSVPVFRALAIAMVPFLFTAPSVSAIIYAMKKTVYIGAFSFFQVASIFLLNYFLIPKYGVFGPTITLGVTNLILAIYTWTIVVKYYWID